MPELTERFRVAEALPARDLWSDIVTREPGPPPPAPTGRRVVAAVLALVVMIIGIAIVVRAFHASHPVVPAGTAANGKILVYRYTRSQSDRISTMNPDGTDLRPLRGLPSRAEYPAWSPTGTEFAFAVSHVPNTEIWIARPDGTDAHRIFTCADQLTTLQCDAVFNGLTWSPDARQIAFVMEEGLFVMNADGSDARQLYAALPGTLQTPPAWSPDGRSIALSLGVTTPATRGLGGSTDIYLAAADGSGIRRLTHCGPLAYGKCVPLFPSWSPDGRRIAYWNETGHAIETVDADGTHVRTLLTAPNRRERYVSPLWSPDGKSIVYVDDPANGGTPRLYEMGSNGSNPKPLHISGI